MEEKMETYGMITVFLCQDDIGSILCGVYDAWMSRLGHDAVRLELEQSSVPELFCQYCSVDEDPAKTEKVIRSIQTRIGEEAWESVYRASLSDSPDKADRIYRFLIAGFRYGSRVMERIQLPEVFTIFEMNRRVGNEAHHLIEFVRFSETEKGILISRISPKQDVAVLLAPHFADRLPGESWIIYDTIRKKAVVHQAGGDWGLVWVDTPQWQAHLEQSTDESSYASLWKAFFKSISIRERENPRCQRNMLPIRFRDNMTEFQ